MIRQNTRESAIRREEFHAELREWLDASLDSTVGDPDVFSGRAWLWVRHGGRYYHLNAETDRDAVRHYLRLVQECRGDPEWSVPESAAAAAHRVAIGPGHELIPGFHFFRAQRRR